MKTTLRIHLITIGAILLLSACSQPCPTCPTCPVCPTCPPPPPIPTNAATVNTVNGVYIFFKSSPYSANYIRLGSVSRNIIEDMNQIKGKNDGERILDILGKLMSNITMSELLNMLVEKAKSQYPDVQGILIDDSFTTCEAIKFN